MTNPIVRMYETERRARDAVAKLRAEGYPKDWIFLMTPAPKPASKAAGSKAKAKGPAPATEALESAAEPSVEAAVEPIAEPVVEARESVAEPEVGAVESLSMAVLAGFLPRGQTDVYAQALQLGRSLVAVRAPFGQAREAIIILDSFDPVAVAEVRRPSAERSPAWDEAAPLSSALQWRTIQSNRPAPFSAVLGLPTLSRGRSFLSPMFGELASPHFALFGRSGLSQKAAPLSSLFGLKTITSGKGGPSWTSSFGVRLLTSDPTPLRSRLGPDLLIRGPLRRHPTPLSVILGLPTLSRGRSFLSPMFGELASPRFALFGRNPLIESPAPLSSRFGIKLLSGKSGPSWRSSFGLPMLFAGPTSFGFPVLSRNPAPLSSLLPFGALASPRFALFGRNPLIESPAPLSSRLGIKLLSGKSGSSWTWSFGLPLLLGPGPLSFGLPLLSRNPAPLSSLFGLRVLSRYQ